MPGDENNEVFNGRPLTSAATEAPGTDNHADIWGVNGAWNGITNTSFINSPPGGQGRRLTLLADHVVQVRHNQIVKIQQVKLIGKHPTSVDGLPAPGVEFAWDAEGKTMTRRQT